MKRKRPAADRAEPQGSSPEGLLCAITLRPALLPRNRFFSLYQEPRARRAHGSAHALRRLHAEVVRMLRDTNVKLLVTATDFGLRITYRDEALSMRRRINLGRLESSLLRVLLARSRTEVPALLRVVPQDRARIRAALRRLRALPLPTPAVAEPE